MPLLLEGEVVEDKTASFIAALRKMDDRIRELEAEVSVAKAETAQAKREAASAFVTLRKLLKPWHLTLKQIYGELDALGPDELPSASASPKWESWKKKLPGRPAEMIDLLLLHGEMGRNQIMAAMHCGKDTVRVTVSRLNVAGLLNKNGGRISLKEL